MESPGDTDQARVSQGEFETLMRRHARVMSVAIRKVCGQRYGVLIPDVEQEVYLALWKRLQSGKKIDHPVSYFYKTALTTALAMIRKMTPLRPSLEEVAEPMTRQDAAAGGRLAPSERRRLIEELLGLLRPEEARAVRAYLAGFNHKEVAALYGWSESEARHRIYRSIEALAKRMKSS